MRADPISELGGLRALARSLVHGDSEAEDLLQDAAVALLEHPPEVDRPLRPWLVTVLLNRWRMDRRGASRRRARERAAERADAPAQPIDALERAQMLRRLGEAVEGLAGPYRDVVIARYFDGKTSIEIARELGVPAATVRTRLFRALERLRVALDDSAPRRRWQLALVPVPLQGGWLVKAKTQASLVMMLIALLGGVVWFVWPRERAAPPAAPAASAPRAQLPAIAPAPAETAAPAPVPAGQRRAIAEVADVAGGAASGRVINWSTGDGVAGAELTFASASGAITIKTRDDGSFELVGAAPGAYTLATVAAGGFLPYSPEFLHSTVRFELVANHVVRDVAIFLFPALDYHGRVVDAAGKPVSGAKVTLVGTPTGEQTIDRAEAAWTSDRDGRFTFHAADEAVLEATAGDRHGWARLDGKVAISKQMVITIAKVAARDATITGRVVDDDNKPLPDVLVRAEPEGEAPEATSVHNGPPRATAFAVTGVDGAFELRGLDRGSYVLGAEAEDRAPASKRGVMGGSHDVALVVSTGARLAGTVATSDGKPVPSFTLLAYRRAGADRVLVSAHSFVDPRGEFELHLEPGKYDLVASARGWAPSESTTASAPSEGVALKVSPGATVVGKVTSATTGAPISYARVMREAGGGGASAQPANAGTVTSADGSFELTGVPPGRLAITIGADSFDQKIEAGMTATDGATIGPLSIALDPIAPGAEPKVELVGIGVKLGPDGDDLLVEEVIPNSGAQAAGIKAGDRIVTVDGVSVTELGLDGAVSRMRGAENTTVAIGLKRGVVLVVTRTKIQA